MDGPNVASGGPAKWTHNEDQPSQGVLMLQPSEVPAILLSGIFNTPDPTDLGESIRLGTWLSLFIMSSSMRSIRADSRRAWS